LPLLKELCPQSSSCGIGRRYEIGEEMRILLLELIFESSRELGTSSRFPSNLDNRDTTLLQPLDFTIHDLHEFFNEVELIINFYFIQRNHK
ncbi:hypothetical protein Tco_0171489, partial [Tanacetum coccineum]